MQRSYLLFNEETKHEDYVKECDVIEGLYMGVYSLPSLPDNELNDLFQDLYFLDMDGVNRKHLLKNIIVFLKYLGLKKRIKQILIVSSTIGAISTLIISLFPSFFLNILYHTNEGIDYIRLLSPFTILFYIEYPLINALQALNKSKDAMKATIINSIVRLFSITIFSFMKIGMYSLLISIIINLVVSTYIYYRLLKKAFNP